MTEEKVELKRQEGICHITTPTQYLYDSKVLTGIRFCLYCDMF